MRVLVILFILKSIAMDAQTDFVTTRIGTIAVQQKRVVSEKTPLIFLHGVYLDHHLWDVQVNAIKDRTIVTLDMPFHGSSRKVSTDWTLDDCAGMLIQVLDSLQIPKVIAIGHSWGSMTIIRAADKYPERFESLFLCNMPFEAVGKAQKWLFGLRHSLLVFRKFYAKQVAGSLFGRKSANNPELVAQLERSMGVLSGREVKLTDRKVIIDAEDATALIRRLKIGAIAVKGREDYVPVPPGMETTIIDGGHISPMEEPEKVTGLIRAWIDR
ncbi:MAG: alpha/beta hydrolase [Saprospiraceae bacterium]|jgi:3-oxoadipate enol-lactonase|nr:alpha/beta hydrolase [Saprospiraceae bacterium]